MATAQARKQVLSRRGIEPPSSQQPDNRQPFLPRSLFIFLHFPFFFPLSLPLFLSNSLLLHTHTHSLILLPRPSSCAFCLSVCFSLRLALVGFFCSLLSLFVAVSLLLSLFLARFLSSCLPLYRSRRIIAGHRSSLSSLVLFLPGGAFSSPQEPWEVSLAAPRRPPSPSQRSQTKTVLLLYVGWTSSHTSNIISQSLAVCFLLLAYRCKLALSVGK